MIHVASSASLGLVSPYRETRKSSIVSVSSDCRIPPVPRADERRAGPEGITSETVLFCLSSTEAALVEVTHPCEHRSIVKLCLTGIQPGERI